MSNLGTFSGLLNKSQPEWDVIFQYIKNMTQPQNSRTTSCRPQENNSGESLCWKLPSDSCSLGAFLLLASFRSARTKLRVRFVWTSVTQRSGCVLPSPLEPTKRQHLFSAFPLFFLLVRRYAFIGALFAP